MSVTVWQIIIEDRLGDTPLLPKLFIVEIDKLDQRMKQGLLDWNLKSWNTNFMNYNAKEGETPIEAYKRKSDTRKFFEQCAIRLNNNSIPFSILVDKILFFTY